MRKLALLIALAALLTVPAVGQFVYVDSSSPTVGGNNSFPWNFSSTSGRFLQILSAKRLATFAGPYKISEVAFARSSAFSSSLFVAKQFQMRMSHTTRFCPPDKAFSRNCDPCPINLIDAPKGFSYSMPPNQWVDVGTHCDFAWDGRRNVCLEIRYRGHATSGGLICKSGSIPRIWANSTTADNYNALGASFTPQCNGGLNVRLTIDKRCICLTPDTASIGSTMGVALINMPGGNAYRIAASLGQGPLVLNKSCTLCLSPDSVFYYSIFFGPPVFNGYVGTTSSAGTANGKFAIPKITALVGLCVFHAGLSFSKNGILCCTNTDGTMLTL